MTGKPTVTRPDGTKVWYQDGLEHREDGPAVEYADGTEAWYKHGKRHREDGPAYISVDRGDCRWLLNGIEMSQRQHAIMRRKHFFLVSTLELL